jgi:glycosyltransferase involved in cell wall biosynthesis
MIPIEKPYLLVLFSVPFYVGADERLYIDPLWAKDLVEHTRYLKRLTLVAPAVDKPLPSGFVAIDDIAALHDVRCVALPPGGSYVKALLQLPRVLSILWRECGRASLVHSAVAGWPFPEAWVLAPILGLRRRPHYINVESASWRLPPGHSAGLVRRFRARVTERLNRWCVEAAELSTFSHEGYRRSLLRRGTERGHVVEASWIDDDNILGPDELGSALRRRDGAASLCLVFAARLIEEKGIRLLLKALRPLIQEGRRIELDIFGDGPLAQECATEAGTLGGKVRLHGSVPYDAGFFEKLRGYHLLVVPTLSDEQPRVVFDAYSQGLPVLASDTDGMRQCVADGETGLLFKSGSLASLQEAISGADRDRLAGMAEACIERARRLTHREMHRRRWALLTASIPTLTAEV